MEVKKKQIFTHHTKVLSKVCKHVHSKETYPLRVHQFIAQQVGKGGDGGKQKSKFHSPHSPTLCMQTCSFKGNLPAESAPVHSTAGG